MDDDEISRALRRTQPVLSDTAWLRIVGVLLLVVGVAAMVWAWAR